MEAKVSVLIDADHGEWKADLIRDVFLEHKADSILSIPISTLLPADRLVWSVAANGKFSVKSAYNLARNGEKKGRGESSDSSIMKRFWQKLWKAKVPNKVRVFGWKACQNILPTKMNLFHRQVIKDPICDACGLEPEIVLHVLCQCPKAREVWTHCRLLHLFEGKGDFADILCVNGMNQDQDSHLLHLILMIAWGIWRNRNERRHAGKILAAATIYGTALMTLQEYYAAQENLNQTEDVSPSQEKWTPPPHGWYKVNTDGAVFSKQKGAGIGVIARDEQGRVVAAMSKRLRVPLGALEVEAKALEAAAVFAKDIGVQNAIFESDSLVVCSAIQGATEPPLTIANITSSTIQLMQQIRQAEVQHTRRGGNRAAHGLAQHAQFVNDFVTWMEETPPIINTKVISDVHQLVHL